VLLSEPRGGLGQFLPLGEGSQRTEIGWFVAALRTSFAFLPKGSSRKLSSPAASKTGISHS
jgi:hypothetical protein